MTGADIAAVLTGLALLVAAVAGAISTLRNTRTIRDTHEAVTLQVVPMVAQVDRAVNGKTVGETTMVSQVQDLHDQLPAHEPPIEPDSILPILRRIEAHLKGEQT